MNQQETKAIDRILFHIESDPKTGHVGMAEMLQIHSKEIREIKDNQKSLQDRNKLIHRVGIAFVGVVTFVVGKSWNFIWKLIV